MPADLYTALVVLTAGRSARMGEPKALLRFGRRTALEVAVHNAIAAGVRRVVAVVGHRAEEIRAAHTFTGLPVAFEWAVNFEEESPMLVSLQVALRDLARLGIDAFFFQPVDVPLVMPRDLRFLMDSLVEYREEVHVFIPSHENHGGHPVLCDAALIPEFLSAPRTETARDVLRRHEIMYVETGNPGILEDMDTRDEYRRLRELFNAREGDADADARRSNGYPGRF